jgi:hypothetical protein
MSAVSGMLLLNQNHLFYYDGGRGGIRTTFGSFFNFHYSATTTSLPEANSLITNERQKNQAFLHFCQAPAITHPIPINYSPITHLPPVHWHFHWHFFDRFLVAFRGGGVGSQPPFTFSIGRHLPMRFSVVFIPAAPAPLVAPRNLAPAVATSLRPPSLSC